jgi:hypothetical protein
MKRPRSNNLFLACQHLGRLSLARECVRFRSLLAVCHGYGDLPATQKAPQRDLIARRLPPIVCRWFRVATRTNVRKEMSKWSWLNSLRLGEVIRV